MSKTPFPSPFGMKPRFVIDGLMIYHAELDLDLPERQPRQFLFALADDPSGVPYPAATVSLLPIMMGQTTVWDVERIWQSKEWKHGDAAVVLLLAIEQKLGVNVHGSDVDPKLHRRFMKARNGHNPKKRRFPVQTK